MPRKKGEDYQPWLNPHLHVWRNKVGELTVINLRNPEIDLGPVVEPVLPTPKPAVDAEKKPSQQPASEVQGHKAAAAPVATDPCIVAVVKSAAAPELPKPEADPVKTLLRQFMAKNEQSKRQPSQPSALTTSAANPVSHLQSAGSSATTHTAALPSPDIASRVRPSPPAAAIAASAAPVIASSKELLSSSSPKPMAFEFVSGTNIPGRGMVVNSTSPPPAPVESPPPPGHSVALFHDPLWGEVDSSLLLSAAAAAPPSQIAGSQALGTGSTPPAFSFDFLQASQGLLATNNAARMAVPTATTTSAAFRTLPAGYTATAAPQLATATIPQLSTLPGMPMTYIQAPNTAAMMPIHYFYSGDGGLHAHQPMVMQGAVHTIATPSQQQQLQHQQQQLQQAMRASAVQSSSSAPSSNPTLAAVGGTRAGTNIEAQPFVPGGRP